MKSIFLFLFIVMYSCSSNDNNAVVPEEIEMTEMDDMPEEIFEASFKLTGDGYDEVISYNSNDNLIFSRLFGDEMWIRLATEKSADGQNGPHIDIDICNYAGSGIYAPVDPQNRPCPEGLLWNIFWHDGDKIYSNQEESFPCELILTLDGDILKGEFACSEVIRFQGTELIEITNGSFSCKIE